MGDKKQLRKQEQKLFGWVSKQLLVVIAVPAMLIAVFVIAAPIAIIVLVVNKYHQ